MPGKGGESGLAQLGYLIVPGQGGEPEQAQ